MNPSTTVQLQHCRPYKIHKAMNDYSDDELIFRWRRVVEVHDHRWGDASRATTATSPRPGAKEALRVPACDDTATAKLKGS